MASELADAIRQLVQEKGISEDLVLKTIEDFLMAAYKRKFGKNDNAVVKFIEDGTEVAVYARKKIVDDVIDEVTEVDIDEAKTLVADCEIGDELLMEINPQEFDRGAVQSAKQRARQDIREIQKDTLYSEFKDKVGEMIIGYYQREKNGNIFVDLGKVEGLLPKKYQSPRETYHMNDRIKAMILEVNKGPSGLSVVLTRTHAEFVRRILELEVPEVYDKTIEVFKIVREPGYRTKIAVFSNREDVDPVGACVGLKGVRIQSIIREMEGEKVDVLKYDSDPKTFIKNALSPADVSSVVMLDESKHMALAIVPDAMLSLAIGKQGLNVRLANRLCDWNIDVKTESQFREMDLSADSKKAVSDLFRESEEEITRIAELPGIASDLVDRLQACNIDLIEDFISLSGEELAGLTTISPEEIALVKKTIEDTVEIVEEEAQESESGEEGEESNPEMAEEYECPECGAAITADMTQCPKCGVELSFEVEEDSNE
jgi:transcription termination/antitermination protein NusA